MATISPNRGFSVAAVAKGWSLYVYMLMQVRSLVFFFHSRNQKKKPFKRKSVRCVKIRGQCFLFFLYYSNRNVDDRKNRVCDGLDLCVNSYHITDFELELLENVLDFHCIFFLPNSIKFTMDRPVEKMHLRELQEILLRKEVSLKGLTEGPTCCKVSNPLFYMIKYT